MEKENKPRSLDDVLPKTRFQFPDGAILTFGTRRDDDDPLQQSVQIVYASGRTPEPEMNILLPPHSIDVMIPVLEDLANQARYIMGQNMVEYPPRPQPKKSKKRKSANQISEATPKPGAPQD